MLNAVTLSIKVCITLEQSALTDSSYSCEGVICSVATDFSLEAL